MTPNNPIELTPNADGGRSAPRSADKTLDKLAEQASALAQRGVDAVRDRSLQARDQALRASDSTLNYIKDEPVKAVLIAAATGAALMALIGLLRKSD
jgi:ElaB/YqjD/DUF883 family membrane-anchored ribosome-binding protein